jgi:pimeloyl-ACP methyl ester carboxylesterase
MILDTDLVALGRITNLRTVSGAAPGGDRALADAALRAVAAPTLVLLAEHSTIMQPEAAAARARALLAAGTVEVVPDAGHGLPADDAEWTAARVRTFLDAHEVTVGPDVPADG